MKPIYGVLPIIHMKGGVWITKMPDKIPSPFTSLDHYETLFMWRKASEWCFAQNIKRSTIPRPGSKVP